MCTELPLQFKQMSKDISKDLKHGSTFKELWQNFDKKKEIAQQF